MMEPSEPSAVGDRSDAAAEWKALLNAAVDAIDDPLFDEMNADDYQRLYRLITEQSE